MESHAILKANSDSPTPVGSSVSKLAAIVVIITSGALVMERLAKASTLTMNTLNLEHIQFV